jgi:hypothetical protein
MICLALSSKTRQRLENGGLENTSKSAFICTIPLVSVISKVTFAERCLCSLLFESSIYDTAMGFGCSKALMRIWMIGVKSKGYKRLMILRAFFYTTPSSPTPKTQRPFGDLLLSPRKPIIQPEYDCPVLPKTRKTLAMRFLATLELGE